MKAPRKGSHYGVEGGCSGKKRFKSYYEAERNIKKMRRFLPNNIFSLYHCGICKQWHIGNTLKG